MEKDIKKFSTKELVEELSKRAGVKRKDIDYGKKEKIEFEGIGIVLYVID